MSDTQTTTVMRLLKEGATFEYIAGVTGLKMEEIQKLKSSNGIC